MNEIHNKEVDQRSSVATIVWFILAVLVSLVFIIGAYTLGYYLGSKNISEIETTADMIDVYRVTEPNVIETTEDILETTAIVTEPITEPTVETVTDTNNIEEPSSEALEAPETTETVFDVDQDDLEMLACVIYQEAGGDACCDDCRRRVADVVLNRVDSEYFPDTMYEVLTAKSQYGRFHWTGIVWPEHASYNSEAHAVERAYRIAEEVLTGQHSELYGGGWIWQAEFRQGSEQLYCCGIYFGR